MVATCNGSAGDSSRYLVRIRPAGPRTMIFDQAAVLLFFPDPLASAASFQVLAIHHPQMLAMMEYAFESLWGQKQATELDAQGHSRN